MARGKPHRVSAWPAALVVGACILVGAVLWIRDGLALAAPPAAGPGERAAGVGAAPAEPATPAAGERVRLMPAGPAVLSGTVRIAETKTAVRGGSIEARFVDCAAAAIDPASLGARDPEALNDECKRLRGAVAEDGTYELALPQQAFLVAFAIEPPDAVELPASGEEVRFDAFERREVFVREVIAGVEWRRDFEVGLGASLTGVVVDRATGAPVASALVCCVSRASWPDAHGAYSAANGTFEVAGLGSQSGSQSPPDAEPWRIRVSCLGFQERNLTLRPQATAPTQVTIELDRGVVISGRVVDPRGRGVAAVPVRAVALGREPASFGRSLEFLQCTTTAADGAFAFSVAAAGSVSLRAEGTYLEAEPDHWESGAGVLAEVVATADVHDLRLELKPTASFRVRAVGPDGATVPDKDLTVLVRTADGWRRVGPHFRAAPAIEHELSVCAPAPACSAAPTAGHGVALRGRTTCLALHRELGVVEVPVQLAASEYELPPTRAAKIEGELLRFLSIDVPGPHACFVRDVTFVDAGTGERLRERRFEIRGHGMGSGPTSSFGRLRLELAAGLYDLTISVDGYRPQHIRIDNPVTGYEEVELRLRR